jgi:hypothetical protein
MSSYITLPSSTSLRLRCLAQRIHDLGPAPLHHLMCQIVGGGDDPISLFEQYGRLPADLVRAYHGDRFGSNVIPLRLVSS